MTTLAIQLTDEQARQLHAVAQQLKVPAEQLARIRILDLLASREQRFRDVTNEVLHEYAELYRRLA